MPVKSPEALARKRAKHAEYKREYLKSQEPQAVAYRDREQRRLNKRHGQKWGLHPDRFEGIFTDGEATDAGTYDLLQMYSGVDGTRSLTNPRGITLPQYVAGALAVKKRIRAQSGKRSDLIYFAQGYDHEKMILQTPQLTDEERVRLAKQKSRGYGAVAVKGKEELEMDLPKLRMKAYIGKKTGRFLAYNQEGKVYGRVSYQDIHSFFNTSFLKAIEKFKSLWTPVEKRVYEPLLALIEEGKAARENWGAHDFDDRKRTAYNQAELVLTEWLFNAVRKLCMAVEIYPASLAGPAPVARALIKKHGVESHLKPADYDTLDYQHGAWNTACRAAFKAGWIELTVQGVVNGFTEYDVSSAYPYQITLLPCCAHGEAVQLSEQELLENVKDHPYAIYRVIWACPRTERFGPFPVRTPGGGIYRPLRGEDWVYASELLAFQEVGQGSYRILAGWEWRSTCSHDHPFAAMVHETFAAREQLVRDGNPAEYILKLALNSLYGIMAQTAGAKRLTDENGKTLAYKTPKYSNLFAAGFITAGTRAALYRAAMVEPTKVVGVATDALVVTEPSPVLDALCPPSKVLGTFERKTVDETTLFIAPGVHFGPSGKHNRLRGFPAAAEMFPIFLEAWEREAESVMLHERRFQNISRCVRRDAGGAVSLDARVGTFVEEDHEQNITPVVLSSKRDTLQEPTWYTTAWGHYRYYPPYRDMQLGKASLYMRPIDTGKQYVPDGLERVDPDG